MSTVSLEELTKEKEKLEGDRVALVEQLQKQTSGIDKK